LSVRTILVPVSGGDESRHVLETGMQLARWLDAHADALHVRSDPADAVPLFGEGMSGALVEDLIELATREAETRAGTARTLFAEVRTALGLPLAEVPTSAGASAGWREQTGREDEVTVGCGRLADLIVVGRPATPMDAVAGQVLHAALFETGRPVLVAARAAPASFDGGVAIAWNGSAGAARAVTAALPLLRRARWTSIVTFGPHQDDNLRRAGDLAAYLAWHGVNAEARSLPGQPSVGEALVAAAREARIVIMGAYSHSRLWQMVLGGVTRFMLEETDLALWMAH
jgi:nucleotide-binding universal stress UspA family protein